MSDVRELSSTNGTGALSGGELYGLSYVSTQKQEMGNEDLLQLLMDARTKNGDSDITGLLLHRGDSFFQVIEGQQTSVQELFDRIRKDDRHHRVEIVTEGPIGEREYADWQMAFVELDGQDFTSMPGFSDLLKNTPEARDFLSTLSRSKKLALLFSIME
ncbi:MAG: BLUF domain-containing protein [Pseudomonadota bacterium]